jgi:hypothetical protein
MSENISDLFERGSGPEQSGSDAVPQNVNARALPAAPLVCIMYHSLDNTRPDRLIRRRYVSNEQRSI